MALTRGFTEGRGGSRQGQGTPASDRQVLVHTGSLGISGQRELNFFVLDLQKMLRRC